MQAVRLGSVPCPCCRSYLRTFKAFGLVSRPEAKCPICGALERHRLMHLYMTRKTDLFNGHPKRMLHVAPEPELSRWLRKAANINYVSADLLNPQAMVRMDICDIQYRDNTFDVIYCSHVLEHVPDDTKAMREFWRVLARSRGRFFRCRSLPTRRLRIRR